MCTFSTIKLLAAATGLAALSVASSARADESPEKTNIANSLLPLEVRSVAAQTDNTRLETVANRINEPEVVQEDSSSTDVLGADLVGDYVNESGDVNLPLGLTVFDAMGTTSIGFGGSF